MNQPGKNRDSNFPPWVIAIILLSVCMFVGGVFVVVKSVEFYREFSAEMDPNYYRALELVDDGEYEEALVYLEKSIEQYPNFTYAYEEAAYAYEMLGDYSKSIALLNKAIELEPNDPYFYDARAWSYFKNGDFELALEDYGRALRLDPDDPFTYANRGWVYYENGDFELALEDYTQSIKLDPDDAMTYNERVYAYLELDRIDEAYADVQRALELSPDEPMILDTLGDVYKALEEYDKAVESYSRAISEAGESDPDIYVYYENRASAYLELGRIDEAYEDVQYALELLPDEPMILDTLGDVYKALEEYDKAVESYSRAISEAGDNDPDIYVYYENRASAYRLLGDVSAAEADEKIVRELEQ